MAVREEKKQQTRTALLNAALAVMSRSGGFGGLGLREVTREAGLVPTAFYRHFRDLDELGLALVDEGCLALRRLLRKVRIEASSAQSGAIRASVSTFFSYLRERPHIFEFLARERSGGSVAVRDAIARETRFFMGELANDLRLFENFCDYDDDALGLIAELVVHAVMAQIVEILLPPSGLGRGDDELVERMVKQLRVIFAGAALWRPKAGGGAGRG